MKKTLRRILFLAVVGILWETVYALGIFHVLLFPSLKTIFVALITNLQNGDLLIKTLNTLNIIFRGLFIGVLLSLVLVGISLSHKYVREVIDNFIILFNPIPGMAVFPLFILWFGIGQTSMIAILLHSVIWGFMINIYAGIDSIPKIYQEISLNLELSKWRILKDIYIPACMSYIISGLRAAIARAWRTAIGIELIIGVMANNAGLGWLMNHQRNTLDMPGLLSAIIVIMVVGILIEVVFKFVEKSTVEKWGMKI